MLNFFQEQKATGKLSLETSNEIEKLWNEYKLPALKKGCCTLNFEGGMLGFISVRNIIDVDPEDLMPLKYESGSYDYVSVTCNYNQLILWTDYKDIEPYNRQSVLYAEGFSFESLGAPVKQEKNYREFHYKNSQLSTWSASYAVWGYSYNDIYSTVRLSMSIDAEKVEEFIQKLRVLIGKK